ncbi:hypothetical protein V6N12_002992 [Hibiscus sabdariffa]|uniref:Pentatricopeptide repeat-containing protein n=1 Tax=Hibiscus sabdariffa TaxID=183260 RepID=A0ABR2EAL1_9ROSI
MMKGKGFRPNIVAYRTVINCLCKRGLLDEACILFSEEPLTSQESNASSQMLSRIVHWLMPIARKGKAANTVDSMKKQCIQPNVVTYNTLVDACYKKGTIAVDMVKKLTRH